MQRIASLAACRELGGLAVCAWKKSLTCSRQPVEHHQQWAGGCVRPARPFTGDHGAQGRRFCRRKFSFAGQRHRLYGSQPGTGGPAGRSGGQPDISVVGIPDPLTWIRCKFITYLIDLFFELDLNSVEFDRGVKQVTTDGGTKRSLTNHYCIVIGRSWVTPLCMWSIKGLLSPNIAFYSLSVCGIGF